MGEPLMPPNRRGSGKSGVNRPEQPALQAQPAPQPAAAGPAVPKPAPKPAPAKPAPAIPVAQPAIPVAKPAIPVAQPAIPVAQPVQQVVYPTAAQVQIPAMQVQMPVAQIPVAQPYVAPQQYAQPYVAPAAQPAPARTPVQARLAEPAPAEQPTSAEEEENSQQLMWQMQVILGGTRPWLWLLGTIGFIDGAGIIAVVCYMLYLTSGRLSGPMVATQLGSMFTAFVLMVASRYLFGYAQKIGEFQVDPTRYWLEMSLSSQRSVWRFLAVLNLFMLLLFFTIFLAAVAGTALLLESMPPERP